MNPKVSIIILNWNGWKDTIECLESLYQITYSNYDVIVVDNGSEDESVQKIKEYCKGKIKVKSNFFEYNFSNKPIHVLEYTREQAEKGGDYRKEKYFSKLESNRKLRLILNEKNYGFAEGNNIGMRYTLKALNPEYILLLNNDTVVDKNFLWELVKAIEVDEKTGSAQSLLLKPSGDIIDSLGQELLIWKARDAGLGLEYKTIERDNLEIFGPCAAAALYKSKVLRKTGLFDEDFFVIYEDVDLSWRIRVRGFKSVLVPNSIVYHKRGVTVSSPDKNVRSINRYHRSKNWLLIVTRYYPYLFMYYGVLRYPHRLFPRILITFYYTLKTHKLKKLLKMFAKSLKIRGCLKTNPLLNKIQYQWINR